jgi:hypothetical protein
MLTVFEDCAAVETMLIDVDIDTSGTQNNFQNILETCLDVS